MIKKYKIIYGGSININYNLSQNDIEIINLLKNTIFKDKLKYELDILIPNTKINKNDFPKSINMGKKVKSNQIIICFKDEDKIISFLDVHFQENGLNNKKTAQINYGWSNSEYRRQGFSKRLRIILIHLLVKLQINYLVSIPYQSAFSNAILDYLDFETNQENSSIRFLDITKIDIKNYIEKASKILSRK